MRRWALGTSSDIRRSALLIAVCLTGAGCVPIRAGTPRTTRANAPRSEPTSGAVSGSTTRSSSFDATVMAYNILYQYGQVPNADGSFPSWVCEQYPYVVDHPELRWEHRSRALMATIARERPDILALNEMRGGRAVALDADTPAPPGGGVGPDVQGDMTRWLREGAPFRYRWVSVSTLVSRDIERDRAEDREWPGGDCIREMSANGCTSYDPRTDHFSSRSFLAYRSDRYQLVESGAFEIPLSATRERRFAPWARLREQTSGLELVAVAVHLDAFSGAHRIAAAHRIVALTRHLAPVPVVVLGDFNAIPSAQGECRCSCRGQGCVCRDELLASCEGQSTHRILTAGQPPPLVDTLQGRDAGSVVHFALSGAASGLSRGQRCWPRDQPGPGRVHLPQLTIRRLARRVDYVFASPSLEVVESSVVEPVALTAIVNGEARSVEPSDHLPVRARLRVGARAATPELAPAGGPGAVRVPPTGPAS